MSRCRGRLWLWLWCRCRLIFDPSIFDCELDDGRTTGGAEAQALPHCAHEWRWKTGAQRDRLASLIEPRRSALGESLDQQDAETPDIAGTGNSTVFQLGRIVRGIA